jgi:hypothetical protein
MLNALSRLLIALPPGPTGYLQGEYAPPSESLTLRQAPTPYAQSFFARRPNPNTTMSYRFRRAQARSNADATRRFRVESMNQVTRSMKARWLLYRALACTNLLMHLLPGQVLAAWVDTVRRLKPPLALDSFCRSALFINKPSTHYRTRNRSEMPDRVKDHDETSRGKGETACRCAVAGVVHPNDP